MRDWLAALAVGLVIVVGCATGLGGTLAFLLAVGIAWYLFAARDLGFARARDMLGIRLLPPVWRRDNWLWIETLLEDGERLLMAATVALLVTSLALMFRPDLVYGAALLIAAFYVSEILRGNACPRPRRVRIPDASIGGAMSPQIAAGPAAIDLTTTSMTGLVLPTLIRLRGAEEIGAKPRGTQKRMLRRRQRETPRKPVAKRSNSAMRAQLAKAKRARPLQPDLPSRKPDYPIANRPRRPRPQRPALRKRTMRKPVTQIGRGAPKPAATAKP